MPKEGNEGNKANTGVAVREGKLADLQQDGDNANRGTARGRYMLEHSLQQYGAGRSILLDREGRIIAGNKTAGVAGEIGIEDVIIVPTDGTKLVAVQRMDLDLDTTPEARALAVADNRVAEVDLQWNPEALAAWADEQPAAAEAMFRPEELEALTLAGDGEEVDTDELWKGMPEFEQEDQLAWKSIKVNFLNEQDYEKFARLVGQTLTDKTRSIWYPYQEPLPLKDYIAHDES